MPIASLVLGIIAIFGMCIGLIPFLGWLNWGVIPLAGIGFIISIITTAIVRENREASLAGAILCLIALIIGTIRLIIGCGVF